MHNDQYPDDVPTPHIELPPGVFPPMPGYTIADLLFVANEPVEAFLEAHAIDPGLIRETSTALVSHVYAVFEREDVQYQIATWYQKPYDHPSMCTRSIEIIAEQFGVLALDAAADSLEGSPLLQLGEDFYLEFIRLAGEAIKYHILKLNDRENPAHSAGHEAAQ
ncbi:hypothetical protein NP534_11595 [Pseudomonas sp. 39004]|uniref:hypothetical protein n=1 Tax=Pseudomonas sp. 39004 TaxID=2967213 RepID=UPI00236498F5|nr:hypothetical protein [Pseudomonas sp. 39004]MDD1960748.1 hypothetical protein [Pseudomonas sp. 39004]